MTVASTVYTPFKRNCGIKLENLAADTLNVLLMTSSYTPSTDTDSAYHLAAPSAPTIGNSGTGGTVPNGVYGVKITYVNESGETIASSANTTTCGGSNISTITINSPATPNPLCNATGWYAYVTQAGGSTYYRQQTPGSPTALGSNLTITANPTTSGATAPATSTADIIANEVAGGNGYSTGGLTLTSVTFNEVLANNFTRSWASGTAYVVGQIVKPLAGNGYLYMCVQAGTSGGSPPTWGTTLNALTTDGSVTWQCLAKSVAILAAADATWTVSGAITWRYAVVYDVTSGDLICLIDPLATQTGPTSGTITIQWDSASGVMTVA